MRITIGGLPGSGTTTIARLLSKALSIEVISAGELFRELAREKDLQLGQFNELAESTTDFDRWIDEQQGKEACKRKQVIAEGRLSGYFVPSAELKIWLKAPVEVRAQRVAKRERIPYEAALAALKAREQSEHKRYEAYYGIDLNDLTIYDLVIDTSRWREYDIIALILQAKARLRTRSAL
ncbi:MAG TPA: cytidylate kinase [Methanomicrobia archaeon]|nr:cytidylate kinase [Methanomicrobia archaeon]